VEVIHTNFNQNALKISANKSVSKFWNNSIGGQ